MRKMWLVSALAVTIVLTFGLIGCGSGGDGDGGGGGGGATHPAELVGIWQIFEATIDGVIVAPAEAMDWDEGVTRETVELVADGTAVDRHYDNDKDLVDTDNGTWEVQNGVLTVTFGGDAVNVTYAIAGNILTTTQDDQGDQTVLRWAKVVNLAGHDANLVRAWRVTSVTVNGANEAVGDYFDFEEGAVEAVVLMEDDGTLWAFQLAADGEIVDAMEGTWATGDGEIVFNVDGEQRGAYIANNTSTTFLDPEGQTVHFELEAFAPIALHNPQLVGEWQAATATVDGEAVPLADFYDWDEDSVRMIIKLWADGTAINLEYDAADNVTYGVLGTWSTNGGGMTVNFEDTITFTTANVAGNTLTLTGTVDGSNVVLTFTRVS
ncbi:MAG: lipocalin family protein [Armatimonadetes bacterium]|nr:lipocalin family protein [Armatimonadota bacterium]